MECKQLLLCDYGWKDAQNKHGLAGIFSQFNLPALPFQLPAFFVYLQFEDLPLGPHKIVVNFLSDQHVNLMSGEINGEFHPNDDDPINIELLLAIPPIQVTTQGTYILTVSADGVQLKQQGVKVRVVNAS